MKKTSDKTTLGLLALFTTLSGSIIMLTDMLGSNASADNSAIISTSIDVSTACTFSASTNAHSVTLAPGSYQDGIGGDTVFTVSCNDSNGYVVYAVGDSNDEEGITTLIGSGKAQNINIETGTATIGDISNWAFKVHSASEGLAIQSSFDNYSAIPSARTAIVKRETYSSATGADNFKVSYAVYVSNIQNSGVYTGKVLYALFNPNTHGPEPDPTTLQNFGSFCSSMKIGQTIALADTRDDNVYKVRKLKDGKCWMVDNLRLGDSTFKGANGERKLTPEDSDVSKEWDLPESSRIGFSDDATANLYVVEEDSGSELREYGGYYSWCAATADTCKDNNVEEQNASSSICPKGWRLPVVGDNSNDNEFDILVNAVGGHIPGTNFNANLTDINGPAFLTAGFYINSLPLAQGREGAYKYDTKSFRHYFWSSGASTSWIEWRYGQSIRCVAK